MAPLLALLNAALSLTTASAFVIPRAGGPIYTPIPDDCTVPNPLPPTSSGPAQNYTSQRWAPTAETSKSRVYAYYLSLPDSTSMADRWEGCLEQCNGLSGCVAAVMADGVATPKGYYGTAGGVPSRACLMFNQTLTEDDFHRVEKGWRNETAGNVVCPDS